MKAVNSSKPSANFYQMTWCHISDDNILHSHGHEPQISDVNAFEKYVLVIYYAVAALLTEVQCVFSDLTI